MDAVVEAHDGNVQMIGQFERPGSPACGGIKKRGVRIVAWGRSRGGTDHEDPRRVGRVYRPAGPL